MVVPDSGRDPRLSAPAEAPRAAVVTVGDELLNGETVDTNSAWLGRELAGLGVPVVRRYTVGDVAGDIEVAVREAAATADLVLISGGLGPTRDDLTRDAVAGAFGRPLREDPELVRGLEERFRSFGYDRLPETNRSQAQVPEGADVLENRHGSAPGLAMEEEGALVVLLPGVPREVRGIWEDGLRARIVERFGARLAPVRHRLLHTSGIAESRLAEVVDEALPPDLGPVTIAFLPDPLGVDLRLSVHGGPEDEAEGRLDAVAALLEPAIAPWRFDAPSGDLAEALVEELRARGATLAVAESCTGGLLSERVTRIAGVSDVFLGGVVAYANSVKTDQLGVSPDDIEREGAVSEIVARQMAEGVARRLSADAGMAITGVAGPGGGSPEKPVGTVWIAACFGGETRASLVRFPGSREDVRARSAQAALRLLRALLGGRAGDA